MSAKQNQPLRPINDIVLPKENDNVILLNNCPWRYTKEFIDKFNEDQEKANKEYRMPKTWANWQNKKHYSNLN